jgi:hypothetical protein
MVARQRQPSWPSRGAYRGQSQIVVSCASSQLCSPRHDQIEDLLRRIIRKDLEASHFRDSNGDLRLIIVLPSWEDYLGLAFDEIRQYGANSVQIMRRLRAALAGLVDESPVLTRVEATRRYLKQLDLSIDHSEFDPEDKDKAKQEDRQGLGLSRATGLVVPFDYDAKDPG